MPILDRFFSDSCSSEMAVYELVILGNLFEITVKLMAL